MTRQKMIIENETLTFEYNVEKNSIHVFNQYNVCIGGIGGVYIENGDYHTFKQICDEYYATITMKDKATMESAFLSMLYLMRENNIEVPKKYKKLENDIYGNYFDMSSVDLKKSVENIYDILEKFYKTEEETEEEIEDFELQDDFDFEDVEK